MKTIKKIIISSIILLLCVNSFNITQGSNLTKIENRYISIINTIEQKYSLEKTIKVLKKISSRVDVFLEKKSLKNSDKEILNLIKKINTEKLLELLSEEELRDEPIEESFTSNNQLIVESNYRKSLKADFSEYSIRSFIENFEEQGFKFLSVNSKFEYVDGYDVKKIIFTKYILLNNSNYKTILKNYIYSDISKIIVYDGNKYYIPGKSIKYKTKHKYSKSTSLFKYSISKKDNYLLEKNIYYTFIFDKFVYFSNKYGFYDTDLENNGVDTNKTLLYYDGTGYKFVKEYTKNKLFNSSLIIGVKNKKGFLSVVVKDSKYTSGNNDIYFTKLKEEITKATTGFSEDEKIEYIYKQVLDSLYYYVDFDDGNQEIFSGIDSYKNGYGVCDGYTKLMYYMLAFAGVEDIEHIRGYVLDAPDFPNIGHAWIRIGNKYYDPTFDDPIGIKKSLSFSEYKYYDLPKDIAYTNRLDGFNASDKLKNMSLSNRLILVEKNIYKLLDKYTNTSYNVLKAFKIKKELGISPGEAITITKLKNLISFYKVTDGSSFQKNNKTKYIKNLKYYIVTDKNINQIINQLGEEFIDSTLFEWTINNGEIEYRLAYYLKTN